MGTESKNLKKANYHILKHYTKITEAFTVCG